MSKQTPPKQQSAISNKPKSDTQSQATRISSKREIPNKRDSFQQAAVKQVLVSNSVGDGLWCYQREQTVNQQQAQDLQNILKQNQPLDPELVRKSEQIVSQKTKALNNQFENEIIEMLEKQCNDLGGELERQTVKIQHQNIQIAQQQQYIGQQNEKLQQAQQEIQNLRTNRLSLESQIESIKDLYNKAKREVNGLQTILDQEKQEKGKINDFAQKQEQTLNQLQSQLGQELEVLRERCEELEEENDEFKNRLQIRGELEKRVDAERNRQQNEQKLGKIKETEYKIEKMSKLLEENATLTERYAESEVLRKKFMEKNQLAEKEIKQLSEQTNTMNQQIVALKKRVNDLTILKSTNNKLYEDKISKLIEQSEQTLKENERLKKLTSKKQKQQQQRSDEDEQLENVEAKPQLFGS